MSARAVLSASAVVIAVSVPGPPAQADELSLPMPDVVPGAVVSDGIQPPADLDNAVAIASAYYGSYPAKENFLALRADGTVVAWGSDQYGQSQVPVGLDHVVAVDTAAGAAVALGSDGSVVAWGSDETGVVSGASSVGPLIQVALGGVAGDGQAGCPVAYGLRPDHTVVRWGGPSDSCPQRPGWDVPAGLDDVVQIDAGASTALALRSDGSIVRFGPKDGENGGSNPATWTDMASVSVNGEYGVGVTRSGGLRVFGYWGEATGSPDADDVAAVSAGLHTAILLRDGHVRGFPGFQTSSSPGRWSGRFQAVAASWDSIAAITDPREQTPTPTPDPTPEPTPDPTPEPTPTPTPEPTPDPSLPPRPSVRPDRMQMLPGNAGTEYEMFSYDASDLVAIDASGTRDGGSTAMGVRADGTVLGWGSYYPDALHPPADLDDVVDVDVGGGYALALRGDGSVRAWGSNVGHALDVPADLGPVIAVSAGGSQRTVPADTAHGRRTVTCGYAVALRPDHTLVAWGGAGGGECKRYGASIQPPDGLTDVVSVSAGDDLVVAARADGTVAVWGPGATGKIRREIAGWRDVTQVSTARGRVLGLGRDGELRAVGYFWSTHIPAGPFVQVSAGMTSVALRASGDVAVFGTLDYETYGGVAQAVAGGDFFAVAIGWGNTPYGLYSYPIWGEGTRLPERSRVPAGKAYAFGVGARWGTIVPVDSFQVYLDRGTTARTLTVGLYADGGSGEPSRLITTRTVHDVVPEAWTSVYFEGHLSVEGDKGYWLAVMAPASDGGSLVLRTEDTRWDPDARSSARRDLEALPDAWSTGNKLTLRGSLYLQ